ERACRLRLLFERHRKPCFAVLVGVRQVFERLARSLDVLVSEPELVAREARPLARRPNDHLALKFEFGSRRAIEETPLDRDLSCARLGDAFRLGAEIEFD